MAKEHHGIVFKCLSTVSHLRIQDGRHSGCIIANIFSICFMRFPAPKNGGIATNRTFLSIIVLELGLYVLSGGHYEIQDGGHQGAFQSWVPILK